MQRMTGFFKNVRLEMKKVTWPTRRELTRYTLVVLATIAFFLVFFIVVDFGISTFMKLILE